jgi:hypothetical protein
MRSNDNAIRAGSAAEVKTGAQDLHGRIDDGLLIDESVTAPVSPDVTTRYERTGISDALRDAIEAQRLSRERRIAQLLTESKPGVSCAIHL